MVLFGDTQAAQQVGCIAFGVPSFHLGELLFEFRNADTVGIAEVRLFVKRILFAHDFPQGGVSHQDRVHNCIFVESKVVLA